MNKASRTVIQRRAAQARIAEMLKVLPAWAAETDEHGDIIQSTRIRLARNLFSFPFPSAAGETDLFAVVEKVQEACGRVKLLEGAAFFPIEHLDSVSAKVLVERRLISPAFAEATHPCMAVVDGTETLSIMVNEEDHLRLQSLQPGQALREAWRNISRLDDELSEQLDYAFSYEFGYLTACPTNTGTGMRASILVHLPALSLANRVEKLIRDLAPSEIAVRGFYGEGTEVIGHIFQISNQLTLGRSETAIVNRLEIVANKFMEMEREARENLLHEKSRVLEDKIHRAYALLKAARLMSSLEFMNHLSMVRLGVDLGLLDGVRARALNELMIFTQPAHMQKRHENLANPEHRDALRAQIIREKFTNL